MDKKKLLIVSTTFPRWKGDTGPAPFVYHLARYLTKYYEVSVLSPHYPSAKRYEVLSGLEIFRFRYIFPERFEVLADGAGLQNHFRSGLKGKILLFFFLFGEFFSLAWILLKGDFELVNSHWLFPSGFIVSLLKPFFRFSHYVTIHAADYYLLRKNWIGRLLLQWIARGADGFLPVSDSIADGLRELLKREVRMKVVPMGVELKRFREVSEEEVRELEKRLGLEGKKVILFVGKLTEKKGVRYLLEAMKLVMESRDDAFLLIVGEGHLRKELEKYSEELGLKDSVKFIGGIDQEQLIKYYHLSRVVAVPSIMDRYGESEGMPVVIPEALACLRPVVGSPYCSFPEEIDKKGFYELETGNAQEFSEILIKALESGLEVDKELAEKFDWSVIVNEYRDFFEA